MIIKSEYNPLRRSHEDTFHGYNQNKPFTDIRSREFFSKLKATCNDIQLHQANTKGLGDIQSNLNLTSFLCIGFQASSSIVVLGESDAGPKIYQFSDKKNGQIDVENTFVNSQMLSKTQELLCEILKARRHVDFVKSSELLISAINNITVFYDGNSSDPDIRDISEALEKTKRIMSTESVTAEMEKLAHKEKEFDTLVQRIFQEKKNNEASSSTQVNNGIVINGVVGDQAIVANQVCCTCTIL